LCDRRYLDSQLVEKLNSAQAEDYPLTIALIDVDNVCNPQLNHRCSW